MANDLCSDDTLAELLTVAAGDDSAGLDRIGALLEAHPADPRLHFLKGSLLAQQERYAEGLACMRQAVAIAPGYDLARFQLGLLELSSGDAVAADAAFAPLAEVDSDNALALFAMGLRHLARDDFDQAETLLRRGIERNAEHPLINRDMELVLAGIVDARAARVEPAEGAAVGADGAADPAAEEDLPAAHLLLQRYADKSTKH